jgi:hypothetical protein
MYMRARVDPWNALVRREWRQRRRELGHEEGREGGLQGKTFLVLLLDYSHHISILWHPNRFIHLTTKLKVG